MSNGMIVVTKIRWRFGTEGDDVGNLTAHS
jgi:hypothetical protein